LPTIHEESVFFRRVIQQRKTAVVGNNGLVAPTTAETLDKTTPCRSRIHRAVAPQQLFVSWNERRPTCLVVIIIVVLVVVGA
jgi:hypothetical protein